jgi:hypothetical protein
LGYWHCRMYSMFSCLVRTGTYNSPAWSSLGVRTNNNRQSSRFWPFSYLRGRKKAVHVYIGGLSAFQYCLFQDWKQALS